MSSSLTDVVKQLSEASQTMEKSQSGGTPDLDEDLKEIVKQAIYEVREEQRGKSSQSGSSSGQSGKGSQQQSKSGQSSSSSSGSGPFRQLMMLAGLAAAGYMMYKRRQSKQSTTHIEHKGETRHTSPSDLPEAETVPPEGEPPYTSESSESDGGD